MGQVNYENLLAELIKPLVAHPEDVETIAVESNEKYCIIFLIRHMPLFKEQKWIYSKNVMNLTKLKS